MKTTIYKYNKLANKAEINARQVAQSFLGSDQEPVARCEWYVTSLQSIFNFDELELE